MNLFTSFWRLWHAKQLPTSAAASSSEADPNDRLFSGLQRLCASLPQGEAEVWLRNGEITFSVKWAADEAALSGLGDGFCFRLNGQNEEVKVAALTAAPTDQATPSPTPSPKTTDNQVTPSRQQTLLQQLLDYLRQHYAFRYNRLTDQTECAVLPVGNDASKKLSTGEYPDNERHTVKYESVDNRLLNSISLSVLQAGIPCWDRDVKRYIDSANIPAYHPFTDYMDRLPAWDGVDRVTPLAQRVSRQPLWVKYFHRWMLATTAQWMHFDDPTQRANSVAPLLVSPKQGLGKSTFCRMLLPESLQRYFTESFDLTNPGSAEQKLASFGLINLDEFDRLPANRMPQLKNLMQLERLHIRRAYKHSGEPLPRIASFIGTSNRRDLLTDRTGSRRFLCVEVEGMIDCTTPIEYEQLYAQLKHEIQQGERTWFSKEEETAIQEANEAFYRTTPAEDLLGETFTFAQPNEEGAYLLSAAQIYTSLRSQNPAALRDCSPAAFSKLLAQVGQRVHTRNGNGYWVKPVKPMK
ncbi:helicase [gut metagenome]|uniref:Helicase n=1 Tax=gut metagenome TaxID=749906 RepID=J9CS90_9ZZZZ